MSYKGVIIEESLSDSGIIKELEIVDTYISKTTARETTPWLEQWTLQTVIIPEEKIEEFAKRLSALIDKDHISSWYCDFRNDTTHYVIFSEKVFKLDRANKQDYNEIRTFGIELGIPTTQLPNFNDLDENLSEEAMDKALRPALMKVGEDDTVLPVRGPSKFENDGYTYIFESIGQIENFTGLEEIYKDKKLVYRLHCHGGIIE